jgi:hypothetical protein
MLTTAALFTELLEGALLILEQITLAGGDATFAGPSWKPRRTISGFRVPAVKLSMS